MSKHLADTHPVARKDYHCYLCAYLIPKGTRHVANVSVDCGSAHTFRMHNACADVASGWEEEDWEYTEPWSFRDLPEFVNHTDYPAIVEVRDAAAGGKR